MTDDQTVEETEYDGDEVESLLAVKVSWTAFLYLGKLQGVLTRFNNLQFLHLTFRTLTRAKNMKTQSKKQTDIK